MPTTSLESRSNSCLDCAQPNRPGLTLKRRMYKGIWFLNCSTKNGRSGRGPTKLMSPRRKLMHWGISSKCRARSTRPTGVTRGSAPLAHTGPVFSSASTYIERNLSIAKVRPPSPTRSWRKKTGPLEVSLIAAATNSHNGAKPASTTTATTTSMSRLTVRCQVGISSGLSSISGTP